MSHRPFERQGVVGRVFQVECALMAARVLSKVLRWREPLRRTDASRSVIVLRCANAMPALATWNPVPPEPGGRTRIEALRNAAQPEAM